MSTQPEYDVIVVGAGPAGSACAITLARRGVNVLVLEKARVPGERNVTGGVLYGAYTRGYGIVDLLPDFETNGPVERRVVSHRVFVISAPEIGNRFRYYEMSRSSLMSRLGLVNLRVETGHDYTVAKSVLDRWMARKAVEEGAMLCTGTTVEDLIVEGGQVKGVVTTHEQVRCKLVVDCSGVTSKLVERLGLRERLQPSQLYHGIKHTYRLTPESIDKRFGLRSGEGSASFFFGDFMRNVSGGAFIYTNNSTVSVGVVAPLDSLLRRTTESFDRVGKLLDVLVDFENHPMIADLLESAELLEYSSHNIPRGFRCALSRPYADGYLVAGDALGAFVKVGPLIDGMRMAIASGIMAAETYVKASQSGIFGAAHLDDYRLRLSPVYRDLKRARRDSLLTEGALAYRVLPRLLFSSRLLTKSGVGTVHLLRERQADAIQEVQFRSGLLSYDEDREYSHIQVNLDLASESVMKPWVPTCPMNCYTLLTKKGVFASYKDLYFHNLKLLGAKGGEREMKREAMRITRADIAQGTLRFDHVACVACGTCGAIGPPKVVLFRHERDGHGVRYRYG
jgi:electron transfer flavoprotein-quinone oxidoreductase